MEELYDLVDENNNLLGITKPKSLVHKDGDWHRAVHVWVANNQGQLLLQLRSANKIGYPNYWDVSVGGHVSAGEEPATSAVREMAEEVGLSGVKPEDLQFLFNAKDVDLTQPKFHERAQHYVYLYKTNWPIEQFIIQTDELAGIKYMAVKDLEKDLLDNPQNYVPHSEYSQLFEYLRNNQ
jgi:isopentenyldiphosphate isomerase